RPSPRGPATSIGAMPATAWRGATSTPPKYSRAGPNVSAARPVSPTVRTTAKAISGASAPSSDRQSTAARGSIAPDHPAGGPVVVGPCEGSEPAGARIEDTLIGRTGAAVRGEQRRGRQQAGGQRTGAAQLADLEQRRAGRVGQPGELVEAGVVVGLVELGRSLGDQRDAVELEAGLGVASIERE